MPAIPASKPAFTGAATPHPEDNTLSKLALAFASCAAIHVALVVLGGEPVIHAAGESLRQMLFGGAAGACEVIGGELVCPK